eukprot:2358200-Pyramimonas_sp.AAC.1
MAADPHRVIRADHHLPVTALDPPRHRGATEDVIALKHKMYEWNNSSYCRGDKVDVPEILPD